jgi:hypothetical protein
MFVEFQPAPQLNGESHGATRGNLNRGSHAEKLNYGKAEIKPLVLGVTSQPARPINQLATSRSPTPSGILTSIRFLLST